MITILIHFTYYFTIFSLLFFAISSAYLFYFSSIFAYYIFRYFYSYYPHLCILFAVRYYDDLIFFLTIYIDTIFLFILLFLTFFYTFFQPSFYFSFLFILTFYNSTGGRLLSPSLFLYLLPSNSLLFFFIFLHFFYFFYIFTSYISDFLNLHTNLLHF